MATTPEFQAQKSDVRQMFTHPTILPTDMFMTITDGVPLKPTVGHSSYLGSCLIPDLFAYLPCAAPCDSGGGYRVY